MAPLGIDMGNTHTQQHLNIWNTFSFHWYSILYCSCYVDILFKSKIKATSMSNRLKRKKAPKKSSSKCPICGEFFVGLVLHLQRSECVEIAHNANVPEVLHDTAFKRAAIDNHNDEDQWELHSNDVESFMRVNENNDKASSETDNNIGVENNYESKNDNEMYDNHSNQGNNSDVESFCNIMDWYHVLENHGNYTKNKLLVKLF